jgi:hypothetical protein
VAAKPVAPAKPAAVAEGPRRRPRDEDDDRPLRRQRPARRGSNVALIAAGVGVGVFLLLGGVAAAVYVFTRDKEPDVVQAPPPTTAPSPPLNTPPALVPRANWEKPWHPVGGPEDGFLARMPGPAAAAPAEATLDGQAIRGTRYEGQEGAVRYRVVYYDLPNTFGPSSPGPMAEKLRTPGSVIERPTHITQLAGSAAAEMTTAVPDGERETIRTRRIGQRLFLFSVAHDPAEVRRYEGLDPADRARMFFDSVSISYRSARRANPPVAGQPQVPPPGFPPGMPGPFPGPGGVEGGLKLLGRVNWFQTAVWLPAKGELLTFAPKRVGPKSTGVLRRYSATTYKLLAIIDLPGPVTHAAVDEKGGRLYTAVVTKGMTGPPDTIDRLSAHSEVHAYDLAKLLADAPPADAGKPVGLHRAADKVTGLAVAADGTAVFMSGVNEAKGEGSDPGQVTKGTVGRINPDLKAGSGHRLATMPGHLRMAPDGKHLVVVDVAYNAQGLPVPAATSTVRVYETARLAAVREVKIPGAVADLAFVSADKVVVALAGGFGQSQFHTVRTDGTTTVVPVGGGGLRIPGAGFLAPLPGGKVIVSVRNGSGTQVLALDDGSPARSVAWVPIVPGAGPVAGPVVVSPDGKAAAYGSGVVLDLSGVGN